MSKPNTRKGNQSSEKDTVANMLTGSQGARGIQPQVITSHDERGGIEKRDQSDQAKTNDQGTNPPNPSLNTSEQGELQSNQTEVDDSGVNNQSSESNVPKENQKRSEAETVEVSNSLDKSYISALGSKPIELREEDETHENDELINLENKDQVFNKAMELVMAGKADESAKYMKIYQALRVPENRIMRPLSNRNNSGLPRVESEGTDLAKDKPVIKRTKSDNPINIDEEEGEEEHGGVFEGGKVAPPDISKYDEVVVKECFTDARVKGMTPKVESSTTQTDDVSVRSGELFGLDNPYREGGEREGWNAATGKPPEKKTFVKQNQQKFGQAQVVASGSGESKSGEKKKFKLGYQGNNFDPKYAEKKAALLAAKTGGKDKSV
ncbi:hypothetical protein DFH28DRAFT_924000 [Melampsora americana]|nr:hypothetical protein DFH28DRAFT_924000 [Melampsora americana]